MSIRIPLLILLTISLLLTPPMFAQEPTAASPAAPKTETDVAAQLDELPPEAVLKNLDVNIKKIKPGMHETEVFKILGLLLYKKHLKSNSFIRIDGGGGNSRMLLDNHLGYSIAFRDFMGHGNAKCMIRTPNRQFWTDAKTSIPALTTKEMQDDLNRQMEKYRKRIAEQKESKNAK
jgi:hypothetical protein